MALEKLDATQIVTWAPPLPQRAFRITSHGTTTAEMTYAGSGTNGAQYGYFGLDTTQWALREGQHTPPMQPGEKIQLWTGNNQNQPFLYPPPFDSGSVKYNNTSNNVSSGGAEDLYCVSALTINPGRDGLPSGYAPLWVLKDPTVVTVVGVQQDSAGTWHVYYSPTLTDLDTINDSLDGIITIPQPYEPRWLGRVGHVSAVDYTFSLPGGPDQLTCTLQVEPNYRTDAMNPGRIVTAHRGGSCVWEGVLTEPQPTATGWNITCNGVGTYGTNFGAWWDLNLGSIGWTKIDAPVDLAIARGLRWVNNGIGNPATIWEGPEQNPGSLTVTDYLNLLCTGGSLTWELLQPSSASSFPPGPWVLSIYPLPSDTSGNPLPAGPASTVQTNILPGSKWKRVDMVTTSPRRPPDLYIVNTNPIARTIVADYNTIIVYYQSGGDTTATSTAAATAATYNTTFADQPSSVAIHGRMEYTVDVSNAGTMSRAAAQAIGANILAKYVRANFSNAFTVQPGQLLNVGGAPVDLGCNWGGYVASVQVVNDAAGGEVGFAPITFTIGEYEFNDDTQTATVTPYQAAQTDISSIISMLYPGKFS